MNVCGDTEHTVPDVYPTEHQFTLERLQVEVDQFFLRATQQILTAHRFVNTFIFLHVFFCYFRVRCY